MHSRSKKTQRLAPFARRHWLLLTVAGLAFLALLAGQPALAADVRTDVNQTVPPPTPRPSSENNNSNNNNNSNSNSQSDNGGAASSQAEAPAAEATGTVTETATATGALTAAVQVVSLNVRQGPGTNYPVVGKLAEGSEITVDGRNEAGDWWSICCTAGGAPGWVSAALVAPNFAAEQAAALPVVASEPAPEATPAPSATPTNTATAGSGVQGTVAGVNLNVRSGPSTDDAVLGKLRGSDTVTVLGRNTGGDWLYVCCIGTPPANGWVSAQFITPAFAAGDLPEVGSDGQSGATTGAAAAAETPAAGGESAPAAAVSGTGALSVAIAQQPPFAVQGREIALIYTVRNDSAEDLADVVLSSELPGPLALIGATAGAGGEVAESAGSPAVTVTWAAVPAGESATATVRVRVADDVPNGTTFANLASVTAGSGETASSGITIGMPPSLLPEFW